MRDNITLLVDKQKVEHFLSYMIEADIYTADDAFHLDCANPEIEIVPGKQCEVYVNDELEMTGIIDRVDKRYDKEGVQVSIEGRDLCGLLVDSFIETFSTVRNTTMKALAETLLATVPFIQREQIVYQDNVRVASARKGAKTAKTGYMEAQDTALPHDKAQIEPGTTVFEALRTYAASRGMMFFCMPDGSFIFGKPKGGGEPAYRLVTRKSDPRENNILSGSLVNDISRRYSKITVMGQQQGRAAGGATSLDENPAFASGTTTTTINTKHTVTDPDFPFYKPLVEQDNNDGVSPSRHAQALMERAKWDGFQISYKVPGHSQAGKNWKINEMCSVEDEVLGIKGTYLIYGRTFEMSRYGTFTDLRLSYPGVVQQ